MPKLLHIVNRLNIGGLIYQPAYLTKYLRPEFETFLAAGLHEDNEASFDYFLKETGVEPLLIPEMQRAIRPAQDRRAYRALKELIQKIKPDIVHTHAAKAGALGRLAAAACDVPVIMHTFHGHVFHSYFNPVKTRFFLETERYLAKKSHAIIAVSDLQGKDFREKYLSRAADKIKVVEYGFELEKFAQARIDFPLQFRKAWSIPDEAITIGIIGRVVPIKNHSLYLKAFSEVKTKSNQLIRGIIVGDGEERAAMESLCDELGLSHGSTGDAGAQCDIVFTSWQKDIDIVLAGLDIVCLTSLNEGAPVSLIEAQAASRPIVATDVGGVKNVIVENETALLAPSNDIAKVSSQILRLLREPVTRTLMGEKGFKYVIDRFSVNTMAKAMRKIYLELLERSVV